MAFFFSFETRLHISLSVGTMLVVQNNRRETEAPTQNPKFEKNTICKVGPTVLTKYSKLILPLCNPCVKITSVL